MQRITSFLGRFVGLTPKDRTIKQSATEVLVKIFNLADTEVPPIEYQNGVLYVRAGSSLKHAIRLKKTEILERIQGVVGKETVKDIR